MSNTSLRRALAILAAFTCLAFIPFAAAQTDTGSGTVGSGTGTGTDTGSGTGSGTPTGSGTSTSTMLGYDTSVTAVSTFYTFTSGDSTAFVVPFQVNSLGANFSLASVSLLLSGTTGQINNISVNVLGGLPADSSLASALVNFTNPQTGSPGSTSVTFTFDATSTPTLDANVTYYLRIGYDGTGTMNWDATGTSTFSGSGGTPALSYITGSLATGTDITYREVTSGGSTDLYDVIGGFSITANAVSAIPEPAAYAGLVAGIALFSGLIVRWRRRSVAPKSAGN